MLRIVHEKHERHEKNIRCRFLADGVIAGIHSQTPKTSSLRHTLRSVGWRRSGRDAGTQAQGGETSCYTRIYGMCRHSDSPWPGVGQEAGLPGNVLMCFNYFRVFRGLRFLLW